MEKNLCPATYSNLSVYVWGWLTASTANWITPCNALTEELKNVSESQRQERRKMNSHSISSIFDWRIVLSDRSIFAWQSVCAIAISRLVWASHPLDCPSSLQYRIRLKNLPSLASKMISFIRYEKRGKNASNYLVLRCYAGIQAQRWQRSFEILLITFTRCEIYFIGLRSI